jgi:hypothetical protein
MPTTPVPPRDAAQRALRSLVWRVIVACIAGVVVIVAFAIAWRLGAFAAPRR